MIAFKNGIVILIDDETDEDPIVIRTELKKITKTQWEVDGLCIAILGELNDDEIIKEEEEDEKEENNINNESNNKIKEKDFEKEENNKNEKIIENKNEKYIR